MITVSTASKYGVYGLIKYNFSSTCCSTTPLGASFNNPTKIFGVETLKEGQNSMSIFSSKGGQIIPVVRLTLVFSQLTCWVKR